MRNRSLFLSLALVVAAGSPARAQIVRQIASDNKDFPSERNYFDLEDPVHLDRLENPKLALEGLRGLVVIDEIQRRPDLFPLLRVLADRPKTHPRGCLSRSLDHLRIHRQRGNTRVPTRSTALWPLTQDRLDSAVLPRSKRLFATCF